jgi:hypothetical protein
MEAIQERLDFDSWIDFLWNKMGSKYYHGVDKTNRLVLIFWQEYQDDPANFNFDNCIEVLHEQSAANMNHFAQILADQVKMGVTFTIWHKLLADKPYRKGNSR